MARQFLDKALQKQAKSTGTQTSVPFKTRPVAKLEASLNQELRNAIREVNISSIVDSKLHDRIQVEDRLNDLVESMRLVGQEVPIKVRLRSENKYEIVTGRRRLAAAKFLRWSTIKALIVDFDDEAALKSLGAENTGRTAPSFIGRARLAAKARELGFSSSVIQAALALDQGNISKMQTIYNAVGEELVMAIGDAPSIGRRKWDSLAALCKAQKLTSKAAAKKVDQTEADSDKRFGLLFSQLSKATAKQPVATNVQRVITPLGVCQIKQENNRISLTLPKRYSTEDVESLATRIARVVSESSGEAWR